MATRVHPVRAQRINEPPRNWALIAVVGLCVEFWIVVTIVAAQNL